MVSGGEIVGPRGRRALLVLGLILLALLLTSVLSLIVLIVLRALDVEVGSLPGWFAFFVSVVPLILIGGLRLFEAIAPLVLLGIGFWILLGAARAPWWFGSPRTWALAGVVLGLGVAAYEWWWWAGRSDLWLPLAALGVGLAMASKAVLGHLETDHSAKSRLIDGGRTYFLVRFDRDQSIIAGLRTLPDQRDPVSNELWVGWNSKIGCWFVQATEANIEGLRVLADVYEFQYTLRAASLLAQATSNDRSARDA